MENIKLEESKEVIIPFPDIDLDDKISKTILKFIKLRIKSESYHLLHIMNMALKLSRQIMDYCEKIPLGRGISPEPRMYKIHEVLIIADEINSKLAQFRRRENQDMNALDRMIAETKDCIVRGRKIDQDLKALFDPK